MYVVTEYQYQQLRNYCKDSVVDEIGRQPLKEESQTTAVQQLKAEIAALINVLASCYQVDDGKRFSETIIKLRQLSAV